MPQQLLGHFLYDICQSHSENPIAKPIMVMSSKDLEASCRYILPIIPLG